MITEAQYLQIAKITKTEYRGLITSKHARYLVEKVINNDTENIDPREMGGTAKDAILWAIRMLGGGNIKAKVISSYLNMDYNTVFSTLSKLTKEEKIEKIRPGLIRLGTGFAGVEKVEKSP